MLSIFSQNKTISIMQKQFFFWLHLIVLFFISQTTKAQDILCGTDGIIEEQMKDPAFVAQQEAFERLWVAKQKEISQLKNDEKNTLLNSTIYEIPLVFHIAHTGQAVGSNYNPSVQKIEDVVAYLNATFAATWSAYPDQNNGGVDIPIRFVLAQRDPNCNPTNGINRVNILNELNATNGALYNSYGIKSASSNGISQELLKSSIPSWDPSSYYNIWVVNKIDGWDGYVPGSGVAGFAYLPGAPAHLDGTVIMEAFNSEGSSTLPHELGHAFNLLHTFNEGCATGDCATTGDRICDTQAHNLTSGCPSGINPCTNTAWEDATVRNIMNYTTCPDRFTLEQKDRAVLALTTMRGSLLNSLGGFPPGSNTGPTPPPIVNSCVPNPSSFELGNLYGMGASYIKINDWTFNGGNYTQDQEYYIDYTESTCLQSAYTVIELEREVAYPIEINTNSNPQNIRVWLDLNNDGSFDNSELLFSQNNVSPGTLNGVMDIIPNTAPLNTPLRLRVWADFISITNPNPCGSNIQYGQIKDFTVILKQPLPIELKNFKATANNKEKHINLNWEVGNSENFSHFEIERSTDAKNFEKISKVNTLAKNKKYNYTDNNIINNRKYYYRLKMVDNDASYTYSTIENAILNDNNNFELNIYPNPAKDFFLLNSNTNFKGNLRIYNLIGQLVLEVNNISLNKNEEMKIDFSSYKLKEGFYYIKLINETGIISNKKLYLK